MSLLRAQLALSDPFRTGIHATYGPSPLTPPPVTSFIFNYFARAARLLDAILALFGLGQISTCDCVEDSAGACATGAATKVNPSLRRRQELECKIFDAIVAGLQSDERSLHPPTFTKPRRPTALGEDAHTPLLVADAVFDSDASSQSSISTPCTPPASLVDDVVCAGERPRAPSIELIDEAVSDSALPGPGTEEDKIATCAHMIEDDLGTALGLEFLSSPIAVEKFDHIKVGDDLAYIPRYSEDSAVALSEDEDKGEDEDEKTAPVLNSDDDDAESTLPKAPAPVLFDGNNTWTACTLTGKGAVGCVFSARSKETGIERAIKACNKRQLMVNAQARGFRASDAIIDIRNEIEILKGIASFDSSPFLCHLESSWQDQTNVYIAMPLYSETLSYRLTATSGVVSPHDTLYYMAELVDAIAFLHGYSIVHRDIKPDNILVDAEGHLALSDFGLSTVCPQGQYFDSFTPRGVCGTPGYMAPETVDENSGFTSWRSDIWAVGVVFLEINLGYTKNYFHDITQKYGLGPHDDELSDRVCEVIRLNGYAKRLAFHLRRIRDGNARRLVQLMLDHAWSRRPCISAIKSDTLFSNIDWVKLRSRGYPHDYRPAGVRKHKENDQLGEALKFETWETTQYQDIDKYEPNGFIDLFLAADCAGLPYYPSMHLA
ncbi:kinase-like protein [Punctularia strigosozonata HHB-11173 SS5]|uniref:kinase-like protein n=1 Tax=Punctularia strigosozonata (strain HHB-11173) TaxID=741275 RepID=UPI0004417E41|nr:kinase-like protein [Punctularia strigosozonata HHB-11173 SS5]EIN08111.1 kinase-like protein [Punctularia strigosozonata HHB-11173 SS5]